MLFNEDEPTGFGYSQPSATWQREAALWQAARAGSREAFSDLYNHFIRDMLRYGFRVNTDRECVRDAAQDVFIQLWQNRHDLNEVRTVRFYLYRSLRNRIIRLQQTDRLQPVIDAKLVEEWFSTQVAESNWMDTEESAVSHQRLHAALAQLSARQQEAIQLRYFHAFSTEEIAGLMGMNNQSVRNLLHRALLHLRSALPQSLFYSLLLLLGQEIF